MAEKVSAFYNIINTNIDKSRPWYNVKNNTILVRATADNNFKYYLEADSYHPDTGKQLFFILSKDKIDPACRPCPVDNFGRIKIRPFAHKEYLQTLYDRDANIRFDIAHICADYTAFVI